MGWTPVALCQVHQQNRGRHSVCRLNERKGVRYLLAAMPAVFRCLPHFRLVLVGDGPQDQMLMGLAQELGILDSVTFLGFQPQEEVRAWMQRTKLLVLPSLEEGLGVVLLEALACGTPVVASHVDGIPEVITPEVGVLVQPADTAALGTAIQSVLENQRYLGGHQLAARVSVPSVSMIGIISQLNGLHCISPCYAESFGGFGA